MSQPRVIELTEYQTQQFARGEIMDAEAETLWRNYGHQVSVEAPSFKNNQQWGLTSRGWVGHIPLTFELGLALQPKVKLENLLRMVEYAYDLDSFHFLEGLVNCQSLAEFYESLANVLARRVLDRNRRGLYRAYLTDTDRLSYVRGRLDARQFRQRPGQVKLQCHYQEHTPDIEDNQILAWALFRIARSGLGTARVLPTVRRAYRALQGLVTLRPHSYQVCVKRLYNRLNNDYQPMHALCRFFLEHSGPSHRLGERTMLPFLVDMAQLYERFVAAWLRANLASSLRLRVQEKVTISQANTLCFDIDLVVYEVDTGAVRCVLDTKYKTPAKPSTDDISQVIAYATAKGCQEAVLIYPIVLQQSLNEKIGDIRVRSLTFALDGDLEQAGQAFIETLLI